jgi:hypothetical protein
LFTILNIEKYILGDFILTDSIAEQAVLVGVISQHQSEEQAREYLDELAFLVETDRKSVV